MRIRVEFWPGWRVAIVTTEPSWIMRWLGASPDIRIAVHVPAIGGGMSWLWDATSRPVVEHGVVAALEREYRRMPATI